MSARAPGGGAARLRELGRRAMVARGLWPDFTPAALQQAERIRAAQPPTSLRDLRHLPWASIDNDDSRDLDQLSVAEPLADGAARVSIAIADVAAVVDRSTPIDQHAAHNTTTVYTAAQIFPMLPPRLSTDLTVLGPEQLRAAIVIELQLDSSGAVTASDLYRGCVLSQAKLAYDGVGAWLKARAEVPPRVAAVGGLADNLRLQDRIAQAMKQRRHAHGALTLQTLETRVIFDADAPSALRPEQPNRARTLIEEFMIAANRATARFLDQHGCPSVRRVLMPPERWERIVALAAGLHERLPEHADAAALNQFLLRRRSADRSRFEDLSLAIIKLLGRGQYAIERPGQPKPGHFGLAVSDYLHSTAPNRRFPDLLTQRLVHAVLAGVPVPYGLDELQRLASHCTEQEANAAKVERQIAKSAAAMLLSARIGEQFQGMVTGASSKGTWVRIATPPVEGRIVHGLEGLDVGDAVRVRLTHADVDRGFIDFARLQ